MDDSSFFVPVFFMNSFKSMDRGFISEGLEVKLGCSCFTRDCGVGHTCKLRSGSVLHGYFIRTGLTGLIHFERVRFRGRRKR